jgi:hypothetical protein
MVDNGTQPKEFGNGTRPEIPLSCPSSNCTWPEYDTLAVCSKCVETSSLLEHTCRVITVDWSSSQSGSIQDYPYRNKTVCGYFLNTSPGPPILMSGYILEDSRQDSFKGEALLVRSFPLTDMISKVPILGGSLNFRNIRNPILDALIVSAASGLESVFQNVTPIAHECLLAWCVQTIRSSYALGEYKEDIIATRSNTTTGSWPWDAYPVYTGDEFNGWMTIYKEEVAIAIPPNSSGSDSLTRTYGSSNGSVSRAMLVFDDFFPSSYMVNSPSESPMLRYKNYVAGPSLRKLRMHPFLAPNDVPRHMQRLATALSNVIRSDNDNKEMITGQAYNRKQFIVVHWEWLAFPIALLVLSLGFLVATISKTSSVEHGELGVWKTSAMPALIYSLPEEYQRELHGRSSDGNGNSNSARKVKSQVVPKQGWRVSGHHISSPTLFKRLNHQPSPGWI